MLELLVLFDDVLHLLLDILEGRFLKLYLAEVEVVVETVLDIGTDREFDLRVEGFHRLSHDVGEGVASCRDRVGHGILVKIVK